MTQSTEAALREALEAILRIGDAADYSLCDEVGLTGKHFQSFELEAALKAARQALALPPQAPAAGVVEPGEAMVEAGCRALHAAQGSGDADEMIHSPYQNSWNVPDMKRWQQWVETVREVYTAMTAALALKAGEPGWRLVPVEPTREMWAAAGNAVVGDVTIHHDIIVERCWTAMLQAAPSPPSGGGGE